MPRDSAAADRPASYLVGTAAAFPLFFPDRTKPINQLPFSPSAKFPKSGSSCESRVRVALILVVDDGFSVAEVLQSVLADAGHEVVMAVNGRQGLELLGKRRPDLVLLDFMMPIMDGPAMLKAIKADPAYRDVPVVVMSSLPESAVAEAAPGMYAAF